MKKSVLPNLFIYDGDHIALTFDGEDNQTERFLHGTRIDEVIAQENADGEVLWALTDHQGSVRILLDNDGNIVNEITYDAFGNITVETNNGVSFRFSYTGRELDPETGLYNYRARYYDPFTGRFVHEDPIEFNGRDTNLYRYVNNSPLNYRDPSGNFPLAIVPVAAVVAVGIVGIWYATNQLQELQKLLDKPQPFPELEPNLEPGKQPDQKPKAPPQFKPNQEESDPFFSNPNDWFEKMKKLIEDIQEDNDNKEKDKQPNSCPAPWASNDNQPPSNSQNNDNNENDSESQKGNENSWDLLDPNNDPNYVDLKKQLTSEEQLEESGITIVSPAELRVAPRLVKEYGGELGDWVKKTSSAVDAPDGTHIETHWYENLKTGQRVEQKTVINP